MWVKCGFNDTLRRFSAHPLPSQNLPLTTLDKGIYYTLYRKANKIQRVK